ncbi:MAG: hypothetical protein Roseis2KO_05590 [Roseivirga sp.]
MQAIASLADELEVVYFESKRKPEGEVFFKDPKLSFSPIRLRPYSGVKRKLWVMWLAISRLPFFIRKIRQTDLVHTPIPSDLSTIAMLLARWMKKPLFIRHCGNWLAPATRAEHFWKKFMVKHAGKKVTCLATGGGVQPPSDENPQIRWIFSSSLIESEITALSADRETAISTDTVRLVTVSRQTINKGAGRTIDAIKILKEKGFDVVFTVIGRGEYLETLKSRVTDLGLTGNVNFLGQLDNQEVMSALRESHIFTFPSTASEGFPKAVLEAMASGLPIVTSRTSVLPQLVENTHSGFALDDLSPESLAGAIEKLITDKELYRNCSVNAANTARQFSLEKWVDYIAGRVNTEFGWELKRKAEIIK